MTIFVPKSPRERAEWEAAILRKRFLPFQDRWINDPARIALCEKSRQIGFSWASAFDTVLQTAGQGWPYDAWITSRDLTQARLYAEDCEMWAKIANMAAGDLGETILDTQKGDQVSATRLPLANGRNIYSLSSNVDAQAGKRGSRWLDEFALNRENRRLFAIAYPGLTWGGKLRIFSTHRGSQNFFNELTEEVKHKGNPKGISLHTVTLADALREGLLVKLKAKWAKLDKDDARLGMDEDAYLQYTADSCGDAETFNEEFMCIPSSDESAFLSYDLISTCAYKGGEEWNTDLRKCSGPLFIGFDVARKKDLSVIWVNERVGGVHFTRRVIELRDQTFASQRTTLFSLLALPNVRRCCIDATGIGMNIAEDARREYGSKVEPVTFTNLVKQELAFPLRAAFEDGALRIPDDRAITADLRAIRKTTTSAGNIRFDADHGPDGHADRFWALALALHAGSTGEEIGTFRRFGEAQHATARNLRRADLQARRRKGAVWG